MGLELYSFLVKVRNERVYLFTRSHFTVYTDIHTMATCVCPMDLLLTRFCFYVLCLMSLCNNCFPMFLVLHMYAY